MSSTPDWVRVYIQGTDTLVYNGTDEAEGRRAIREAGPGTYELRIDRGLNKNSLTKERLRETVSY